ncbi:MAG: CARDB domain-containing protein, partial [Candidatus Hermodarchaeota archaeon]
MKNAKIKCLLLIISLFGLAYLPANLESLKNSTEEKPKSQPAPLINYIMELNYEYNWIDASDGTRLNLVNDDFSYQSLGFVFPFYDSAFDSVFISENGLLGFWGMSTSGSANNQPFPISGGQQIYNFLIAPFWDDINTIFFGGEIFVKSFGDHWVASWIDVHHRDGPPIASFQVVLYQSGDIIFNYHDIIYINGGYTCGLNYGLNPNFYNSYQGLNPLMDHFSIRFPHIQVHDISVDLDIPSLPEIGNVYNIEATVSNVGSFDESNVLLQLYLDNDMVQDLQVPTLVQGASETLMFPWTPTDFRTYEFRAYAPPVAEETYIDDNEITESVTLYQNYTMVLGIPYNWIDATGGMELQLGDDGYAEISLGFDFPFYDQTFDSVYLKANGYLSFVYPTPYDYLNAPFPSGDSDNNYLVAPFWDDLRTEFGGGGGTVFVESFESEGYWVAEWLDVWHYDYPQQELVVGTFEVILYQTGQIVFNYDYLDYTTDQVWNDGYTCGLNLGVDTRYYNSYQGLTDDTDDFSISFIRVHDISVDLEVPTSPEIGNEYNIVATVSNVGSFDESNVLLQLYLDNDMVQDLQVPILVQDASETIMFPWTPTEFRTYEFRAYASPVAEETNIDDNEITKSVTIYQNYTMVLGIPYNWIDATGGMELQLGDDG